MTGSAKAPRGRGKWGGKRGLMIELSPPSAAIVQARALYPDGRAHHVTLAFGIDVESFEPSWVPGGYAVGDTVAMRAVGERADGRVQALIIEIAGSTVRPWDSSTLHVTVSKQPTARSSESNALVKSGEPSPLDLSLEGVVCWSPEPS